MLHLSLLRHAKSSWKDASLSDHDRPLNGRGRRAAALIGRHIAACGQSPGLILCSTAARARETLDLALATMCPAGQAPPVRYERRLYEASAAQILGCVREMPDNVGHVMVIGHNDGMAILAEQLVNDGEPALRQRMAQKFPTAAWALITFDCDRWLDIAGRGGRLEAYTVPRQLS